MRISCDENPHLSVLCVFFVPVMTKSDRIATGSRRVVKITFSTNSLKFTPTTFLNEINCMRRYCNSHFLIFLYQ